MPSSAVKAERDQALIPEPPRRYGSTVLPSGLAELPGAARKVDFGLNQHNWCIIVVENFLINTLNSHVMLRQRLEVSQKHFHFLRNTLGKSAQLPRARETASRLPAPPSSVPELVFQGTSRAAQMLHHSHRAQTRRKETPNARLAKPVPVAQPCGSRPGWGPKAVRYRCRTGLSRGFAQALLHPVYKLWLSLCVTAVVCFEQRL